jgi:GTP-binding protein
LEFADNFLTYWIMKGYPVVAIIGRQNVGKSSIFNAIAGRRIAITDKAPGITRDRLSVIVTHQDIAYELYDTGGYGLTKKDELTKDIQTQIEIAINLADLILFVVDTRVGITDLDEKIAEKLRRLEKKIILVANKSDSARYDNDANEFYGLGLGDPIPASAVNMRNIDVIKERVISSLPKAMPEKVELLKIAIVGKRNVGKSTLVNTLLGEQRVIVSEIPGTTRDSINVLLEYKGKSYVIVDTAGLRKRQKISEPVDLFSRARVIKSIGASDIVIFLIDVTQEITHVDKKIGNIIEKFVKPCIIALNKWDLVPDNITPEQFVKYVNEAMPVLSFAPIVFLSAKTGFNAHEILPVADDLNRRASMNFSQDKLDEALQIITAEKPPPTRGTIKGEVYYIKQIKTGPQTFLLKVNNASPFDKNYLKFFERKLKERLEIEEIPVIIKCRAR